MARGYPEERGTEAAAEEAQARENAITAKKKKERKKERNPFPCAWLVFSASGVLFAFFLLFLFYGP